MTRVRKKVAASAPPAAALATPSLIDSRERYAMRHALGLNTGMARNGQSYRNRYTCGCAGDATWRRLTSIGFAELVWASDEDGHSHYRLTRAGADAVVEEGETLDPEDFP